MPNERSVVVGYVLWFFLGLLGIHRFYYGPVPTLLTRLTAELTLIQRHHGHDMPWDLPKDI